MSGLSGRATWPLHDGQATAAPGRPSAIVCAAGVPHVPSFPAQAAGGDLELACRYTAVADMVERAQPTVVVVVTTDHFNGFFLDCWPSFALSIGETVAGPVDLVPGVASSTLATDPAFAGALCEKLIVDGFDLAMAHELRVDHSVIVPLHFLNPQGLPVVVLHINGLVPPFPTAKRCGEIGASLARAIARMDGGHRAALVASGAFSQEVGGPRVDPESVWSIPRPDWAALVAESLQQGRWAEVVEMATPAMLAEAGTVAGELLCWLAVAAAADGAERDLVPRLDYRPGEAFAFGTWGDR